MPHPSRLSPKPGGPGQSQDCWTTLAYCRVSTDKQGRSGLGLEAQDAAIRAHLRSTDTLLQPPYIEVESGRRADRPKLQAAIDRCSRTGATLLIAKLDRLARSVAFISNLMDSGVEFEAADFPKANRLTVHILSAVAEHEAKLISERTKAALAAAKARGTRLGGDRGYKPLKAPDSALATKARMRAADHKAFALLPVIERLQAEGVTSFCALAKRLTQLGHPTPRLRKADDTRPPTDWTATAVKRILSRVRAAT